MFKDINDAFKNHDLPNVLVGVIADSSTTVIDKNDNTKSDNIFCYDDENNIRLMNLRQELKEKLGYDDLDVSDAYDWLNKEMPESKIKMSDIAKSKAIRDEWDGSITNIDFRWRNRGYSEPVGYFFPKLDFSNVTSSYGTWIGHEDNGLYCFPHTLDLPKSTDLDSIFNYTWTQLPRVINTSAWNGEQNLFYTTSIINDLTINLDNATSAKSLLEYVYCEHCNIVVNAPKATAAKFLFWGSSAYNCKITINMNELKTDGCLFGANTNGSSSVINEDAEIIINAPKIESLYSTFQNCNVKKMPIFTYGTSTVKNMCATFYMSPSTCIDITNWDTSNVTDMSGFLNKCCSLTSVGDLSNWNTSNVTTLNSTFDKCYLLTSVGDLSNWNVSNVTNTKCMFQQCHALTSVGDLSNWNTSNIQNMRYMFSYCTSLTILDIYSWDTTNVTNISHMFTYQDGTDTGTTPNTVLQTLRLGPNYFKTACTDFDFNLFQAWSHDSMIESLYTNQLGRDVTQVKNLTIHADALARLSETEKGQITALGFTLIAFSE